MIIKQIKSISDIERIISKMVVKCVLKITEFDSFCAAFCVAFF